MPCPNAGQIKITMRNLFLPVGVALIVASGFTACEYDKLPEPEIPELCETESVSYDDQMKNIIDNSCAYSGCHDGAGGIGPFNFTTYDGISHVFGSIRKHVIELKDDPGQGMPPNNSVYSQSRKDDLTEEELALFECWIDGGFPEN